MKPILQRYNNDCVIASCAMLLNLNYSRALSISRMNGFVPGDDRGVEVWRALEWFGFDCEWGEGFREEEAPAILSIHSYKQPGLFHAVVWDGRTIIDPNERDKVDLQYVRRHTTHTFHDLSPLSL